MESSAERALQSRRALSRWDGEGGAGPGGPQEGWNKDRLTAGALQERPLVPLEHRSSQPGKRENPG